MIEIFINTDDKMVPGEIGCGKISGPDGELRRISVKCIRTATMKEYLQFVNEYGLIHMVNRSILDKNLYLVEVLD